MKVFSGNYHDRCTERRSGQLVLEIARRGPATVWILFNIFFYSRRWVDRPGPARVRVRPPIVWLQKHNNPANEIRSADGKAAARRFPGLRGLIVLPPSGMSMLRGQWGAV